MSDGFWKILALKGIKGGGDTPTQEKTVALDMANGNQIITPDDGKTMTEATVLKPATMAAENIKSGVNIGGVVGSLVGKLPEEEKTITITENGTTEVNATDGKAMTKVVVTTNVAIDNKVGQIVDGSITELTAGDLEGATKLRDSIFSQYSSLTKVAIPSSVISIGNEAFYNCRSLTDITIGNDVTSIGESAFYGCSSLTSVTIPNSVKTVGNYMFYECNKLANVVIGNSVTAISNNMFYLCANLTNITIGNGVTSIGGAAFFACGRLASITIPDSVTSISSGAFNSCTSLKSITIPSNVTSMGGAALRIGGGANEVIITMLPTTPPTIASNTFTAEYLNKIIVPKGTSETYKAATNWSAFADYIEEAEE